MLLALCNIQRGSYVAC